MKKKIAVNLDEALIEKVKEKAEAENRSTSNALEQILIEYFEDKAK